MGNFITVEELRWIFYRFESRLVLLIVRYEQKKDNSADIPLFLFFSFSEMKLSMQNVKHVL